MPILLVKMFPQIIRDIKESGYKKQVTLYDLENSIMRVTGTMQPNRIVNTMERLGFIKKIYSESSNIFMVCQTKPYEFIEDENNKKIDNILESGGE